MRRALALASLATAVALGLAPSLESSSAQLRDGPGSVWNGDIYVVNADGTGKTRLTRHPAEEFDPAWSPDGTKIAFSRFTGRRFQVFVMDADGSDATQLTSGDGGASDAAWSPDGTRIAFTRCRGTCDIYVINADGTGEMRLTHGEQPGEQSPTWSPDGRRIAFVDINGLFVMDAEGGAWQRLTDGPADDANPAWSPIAPVIAFDGSRGLFHGDIYVVGADGGEPATVTESLSARFEPVVVLRRAENRVHAQAEREDARAAPRHERRRQRTNESSRDWRRLLEAVVVSRREEDRVLLAHGLPRAEAHRQAASGGAAQDPRRELRDRTGSALAICPPGRNRPPPETPGPLRAPNRNQDQPGRQLRALIDGRLPEECALPCARRGKSIASAHDQHDQCGHQQHVPDEEEDVREVERDAALVVADHERVRHPVPVRAPRR